MRYAAAVITVSDKGYAGDCEDAGKTKKTLWQSAKPGQGEPRPDGRVNPSSL